MKPKPIHYVVGFLWSADGQVLMRLKTEQSSEPSQAGTWNGLGGKVEKGETPHAAMLREFEEELELSEDCAVTPRNLEWTKFSELRINNSLVIVHAFVARFKATHYALTFAGDPSDTKKERNSWVGCEEFKTTYMLQNTRYLLEMAQDDWLTKHGNFSVLFLQRPYEKT